MNLTGKKIVYVCGRNVDIICGFRENRQGGSVSVHDGKILLNLVNYTQVYTSAPEPKHLDEFIYAVVIDEDKLQSHPEKTDDNPITRVWDGPKNARSLPNSSVSAWLYSVDGPFDDGSETADQLKQALDSNQSLLNRCEDMATARKAAEGATIDVQNKAAQVQEQLDASMAIIHNQKTQIADLSAGNAPANVKALADLIVACSELVLIDLPYIGEQNVQFLKKWAHEQVSGEEDSSETNGDAPE